MNALLITLVCFSPVNWADDDSYQVCKCWPVEAVPAVLVIRDELYQEPKEIMI